MKHNILLVSKEATPATGRNVEYERLQQVSCPDDYISFIYGDIEATPNFITEQSKRQAIMFPAKLAKSIIDGKKKIYIAGTKFKLDNNGYWVATGNKILGSIQFGSMEKINKDNIEEYTELSGLTLAEAQAKWKTDKLYAFTVKNVSKLQRERKFNRKANAKKYQDEVIFISENSKYYEPVNTESEPMQSGKTITPDDVKEGMLPFYAIEHGETHFERTENTLYEVIGYKLSDNLIKNNIQQANIEFSKRDNQNWILIENINELSAGKYICRTLEGFYTHSQKNNNQFNLEIKEMQDYNPVTYYRSLKNHLSYNVLNQDKELTFDSAKEAFYEFVEENWFIGDVTKLLSEIREQKDFTSLAVIKSAIDIFQKARREVQSVVFNNSWYNNEEMENWFTETKLTAETFIKYEETTIAIIKQTDIFYSSSLSKKVDDKGVSVITGVLK